MDDAAMRRFLVDNLSLTCDVYQYDGYAEFNLLLRVRNTDFPPGHPSEFIVIDRIRETWSTPER